MKIKKTFFFIFSFLFLILMDLPASPSVKFENPEINSESKVLFTVENQNEHSPDGIKKFSTLFLSDLSPLQKNQFNLPKNQKSQNPPNLKDAKILTCFPEELELLSGGSVLQIRNRYGTARFSVPDETLAWLSVEKSLATQAKGLAPSVASSSGKWICYLEKTSAAKGRLILKNAFTFQTYILDEHADFDYSKIPAAWCPERELLLYQKENSIYFCDPRAYEKNMQMSDEFRKIGDGNINSVQWANSKYFIYIAGSLIYKISADELYTRALYSSIVGSGVVVGKLPLGFDARKDKFWINPLCDKLAVVNSSSVLSLYKIDGTGSQKFSASYSKPLSAFQDFVQESVFDFELFWSSDGSEILFVNMIAPADGKKKSYVYRLTENASPYITSLGAFTGTKTPLASPNGRKLAFGAENHLFIYDILTWKLLADLNDENPVSYVWSGNDAIFAGGSSTVRKISFDDDGTKTERLLFLSSVKSAFWKPGTENTITAQSSSNDSVFYDYDSYRNTWLESAKDNDATFELMKRASQKKQVSQNGKFRVYLGTTDNYLFENALFVRNLIGTGSTFPIFEESVRQSSELKHIALAFDALDNADGIPEILSVLSEYKIKSTFFLNGEFIKRYPKETRLILASGNDCASMFFTPTDFNEKGYVIDEEFVRRGLARCEDEFFAATGSELSLLWHAPYYSADEKIKSYGEKSGYKYVDLKRFALDTTTFESDREHYLSASDLVEFYVSNAEDKMIIPVSTGISKGTRNDFLYEKLSLLICNLLENGFEFEIVRDLR